MTVDQAIVQYIATNFCCEESVTLTVYAYTSRPTDTFSFSIRTVAMMVPDYGMISEVFLFSNGAYFQITTFRLPDCPYGPDTFFFTIRVFGSAIPGGETGGDVQALQ